MSTSTLLINAATAVPILTFLGAGLTRFGRWVLADPIRTEGERMDVHLELAKRLDVMGEPTWAEEERERGWTAVLYRLEKFEYNRQHRWPFILAVLGMVAYGLSLLAVTAGRHTVPLWLPVAGLFLFTVCVAVVMANQARVSNRLANTSKARYLDHKRRGDVDRFDETQPLRAEPGGTPVTH